MYCSACGVFISQGLSFCNHCGSKLSGAKDESLITSSEPKPELLVSAIAALFILGLVAIAVLIGVMKVIVGFDLPIVLAATILSFLMLFVVEGLLIGLLLRGRRDANEAGDTQRLKGQATKSLGAGQARALSEGGIPSVTEHTTRAFEPILSERKSE